jgi:hypothetical protein
MHDTVPEPAQVDSSCGVPVDVLKLLRHDVGNGIRAGWAVVRFVDVVDDGI